MKPDNNSIPYRIFTFGGLTALIQKSEEFLSLRTTEIYFFLSLLTAAIYEFRLIAKYRRRRLIKTHQDHLKIIFIKRIFH